LKRKIKGGLTSVSLGVFIADTSSTTVGGLSGVTHSSSGLVLEYRRAGQSSWTSVTAVSKTLGTYVSGGIVADGSLSGAYEVDFPDAAFAAGARFVLLRVRGVTNMLAVLIEIELDAVDYQDATSFGLSRIDATVSSRASQTSLDTLDDYVDTEVAAIKAKTDLITTFPSNFGALGISVTGAILTVSTVDELGANALTANGAGDAIETYVWGASLADHITANTFGARVVRSLDANNTVQVTASHHAAAVIHDAQPDSIPEDAFVNGAVSARVFDASSEVATAVGNLQVLTRLDSMIESDGAGQFRFDTIAVSMAAGGGGGTTNITVEDRSITVA